ncbi:unnamed protein product [Choristocarpus tenellus]
MASASSSSTERYPESIVEADDASPDEEAEVFPKTVSRSLLVGEGVVLEALVDGCDDMVVSGHMKGKVVSSRLEVTKKGRMEGTVTTEVAEISGSFDGTLVVKGNLAIASTGKVSGTISFGSITVVNGGKLGGRVNLYTGPADSADNVMNAPKKSANTGVEAVTAKPTIEDEKPIAKPTIIEGESSTAMPVRIEGGSLTEKSISTSRETETN